MKGKTYDDLLLAPKSKINTQHIPLTIQEYSGILTHKCKTFLI